MASCSMQSSYRSMNDKCTTLSSLKPETRNWFVRVLVVEKTPIRFSKWGRQQKIIFLDKENKSMQSIIYEQDVDQLNKLVELYKTYYVGNAKIKEIIGNTPIMAASKHQMILSRSTYIKLADVKEQLPVDHAYELTSFAQFPQIADMPNKQINLLCSVIHVFPPRFVEKTKKSLQDFVIVNEERKPLILTLWEEFLQTEAPYLVENVHNMPIILGMRLSVNTFYGLSIGTVPNSTVLFEPPIPQAKQLTIWINNNKEYIENVVTEKLYEKAKQAIDQPRGFQIRKISQILSLTEMVKSFWIRATLKITDSDNRLYFLACPGCSRACGGAYKYEFTCFYCNNDFPSPKPLLRFQADLYDGTGNLRAFVEHNEAKILLGMSGEEIIEAEQQEREFSLGGINEKFKKLKFLLQIRTSKNELRGKVFVRHTIIACLPASDSSSASHSSEGKSTSLHVHKDQEADVAMIESQESTSKTPEEHLAIELVEHQIVSSGKRKLEPKKDMTKEGLKHSKQD